MSRFHALAASLLVLLTGCAAPLAPGPDEAPIPFGLGGKADGGACDERAPLCWSSDDEAAMRHYLAGADALALGAGDARAVAWQMLEGLDALGHKLDPGEYEALMALEDRAREMSPDAGAAERMAMVARTHAEVAGGLSTAYLAAHAVPLGASVAVGGAADGGAEDLPRVVTDEGMAESLQILRDSGVFGYAYALMLEHTGVLDFEYAPLREAFPFSEPREERAARIVARYAGASTRAAVLVNGEALIPYAGIPLSIAHGSYMQFRLRARMVFEIAAVYGVDIREGHNLLLATGVIMGAMQLSELRLLWGGTLALPLIMTALRRLGRLVDPRAVLRRLSARAVRAIVRLVSRQGAEMVARIGERAVARGAARQVLGYATLGLAMLGDVMLTRRVTRRLGEHAATMFRPWGSGMLHEGGSLLASARTRSCITQALGEAMWADGVVVEAERALLAAHLSRRIWQGGRWVPMEDRAAIGASARRAATAGGFAGAARRCIRERFVGAPVQDRLTALSWILTMAAVDGDISPAEKAGWDEMVDDLRGDAWFGDGEQLRDEHVAVVEDRLGALADPASVVDEDAAPLLEGLDPTQLIEGLDEADPDVRRMVDCALGAC